MTDVNMGGILLGGILILKLGGLHQRHIVQRGILGTNPAFDLVSTKSKKTLPLDFKELKKS